MKAFVEEQHEIEIFIDEINCLCPDIAILAFEVYAHDNDPEVIQDLKSRLPLVVQSIKESIPDYIKLQTVVAQDIPEFNNFPSELGPWGNRTLEFLDKNEG